MNVKPGDSAGEVVLKVGPGDAALLSKAGLVSIQKIVVPTDFSEVSLKAMDYAIAFARQFAAEVLIVHVLDDVPVAGEDAIVSLGETGLPKVRERAERRLAEMANAKRAENLKVETALRSGSAPQEIIETAKEHQADLIILATHGRRGIKRFFLGSTTERVVRHACCPVLVVREKGQEFVETGGG
jgi:universal stress protein A